MLLCSAVSNPSDRSKRFTLFLPWQTCSYRHQLGFSGKYSSHAAITRNDYSLTFPLLSIARYLFKQLSRLGYCGENENAKILKRWQTGDSNPGSLDCESGILPLSYRAPLVGVGVITCMLSGVGWAQRGAQLSMISARVSISRSHHMNRLRHDPPCTTDATCWLVPLNSMGLWPL